MKVNLKWSVLIVVLMMIPALGSIAQDTLAKPFLKKKDGSLEYYDQIKEIKLTGAFRCSIGGKTTMVKRNEVRSVYFNVTKKKMKQQVYFDLGKHEKEGEKKIIFFDIDWEKIPFTWTVYYAEGDVMMVSKMESGRTQDNLGNPTQSEEMYLCVNGKAYWVSSWGTERTLEVINQMEGSISDPQVVSNLKEINASLSLLGTKRYKLLQEIKDIYLANGPIPL